MSGDIQLPAKGQPMTAQWGASVATRLNALSSFGTSGMLFSDGPTGTGFAPLPANLRDRRAAAIAAKPLCFDLVTEVDESGEEPVTTHKLVRCFYMVGGTLNHVPDITIPDEFGWGYLAFRLRVNPLSEDDSDEDVPDNLRSFASLQDLAAAQQDPAFYYLPLYKFLDQIKTDESQGGEGDGDEGDGDEEVNPKFVTEVDLRSALQLQIFDFIEPQPQTEEEETA